MKSNFNLSLRGVKSSMLDNDKQNRYNLPLSLLIIFSAIIAVSSSLWLHNCNLWLDNHGNYIWVLANGTIWLKYFFISASFLLAFWLLSSFCSNRLIDPKYSGLPTTSLCIEKKQFSATSLVHAKVYLLFLLLLMPFLAMHQPLSHYTNFFIYLATDLYWPFFIFIVTLVLFTNFGFVKKIMQKTNEYFYSWINTKKDFFNPKGKFIKYTIFVITLIVYLILKNNLIPFGAEHNERFNYFTGDEPQYCLISHSLIFDQDFDLENNLANREYNSFYPRHMKAHGLPGWPGGDHYSYHRLGIPLLIAPAYYLGYKTGWGERQLIVIFLNILGALLAVVIYSFCYKQTSNFISSLLATFIIAFTNPIIFYTHLIYPEMVAGLLIVYAYFKAKDRPLLSSICISLLPWMHERFGPIALVLSIYLFTRVGWNKKLFKILIPLIISVVLQLAYYQKMYGIPIPIQESWVPGTYDSQFGFFNKSGFYIGLVGLLLDRAEGLLIYAPIFSLSLAGIILLFRNNWRDGIWWVIIFCSYYFPVSIFGFWWGGGAPPPRFFVSIVPLLALPLAIAFNQIQTNKFRWTFFFLTIISIAIASFLITHPDKMFNYGNRYYHFFIFAASTIMLNLDNYFPSLLETSNTTTALFCMWLIIIITISISFLSKKRKTNHVAYCLCILILVFIVTQFGDLMARNIGHLKPNNNNLLVKNILNAKKQDISHLYNLKSFNLFYEAEQLPHRIGVNLRENNASMNRSRFVDNERFSSDCMLFGPYETLPRGKYQVVFKIKTDNINTSKEIALLEAVTDLGNKILANKTIKGTDFNGSKKYQNVYLNFSLSQKTDNIEFRIMFLGENDIWIDWIKVYPKQQLRIKN